DRHAVVVIQPAENGLVPPDNGVCPVAQQFASVDWFAFLAIATNILLSHRPWHSQGDASVGGPSSLGDEASFSHHLDFVAEEFGLLIVRMSDERFNLGQGELQSLLEKVVQPAPDLFSLALRSDKSQEKVIGVPDVAKAPIARVHRVNARHLSS